MKDEGSERERKDRKMERVGERERERYERRTERKKSFFFIAPIRASDRQHA